MVGAIVSVALLSVALLSVAIVSVAIVSVAIVSVAIVSMALHLRGRDGQLLGNSFLTHPLALTPNPNP